MWDTVFCLVGFFGFIVFFLLLLLCCLFGGNTLRCSGLTPDLSDTLEGFGQPSLV